MTLLPMLTLSKFFPRPRTWTLLPSLAGGFLLLGAAQPSHALLLYSAEGGGISGTLGSTAFTDARWSLSALADESTALSAKERTAWQAVGVESCAAR